MHDQPRDCSKAEVQALMCELLDPGTTPTRAREIHAELTQCPDCRRRIADEQQVRILMRQCTSSECAPGYLRERITTQIRIISSGR